MQENTTVLEQIPADNITTELAKENITERVIAEMAEECKGLTINGIEDKEGYKKVNEARIKCKNTRVLASKICKKGREAAIEEQRRWVAKEKEVTGKISEIEYMLEARTAEIDNELARIKAEQAEAERLRIEARFAKLHELGCVNNGVMFSIGNIQPFSIEGVKAMPDNIFEGIVKEVSAEAARIEAERKAEEERIRIEQEEAERQILEEQKRIEEERAELARLRAEQDAREEAIRMEREKLENEKREAEELKERTRLAREREMVEARQNELQATGATCSMSVWYLGGKQLNEAKLYQLDKEQWAQVVEEFKTEAVELKEREKREKEEREKRLAHRINILINAGFSYDGNNYYVSDFKRLDPWTIGVLTDGEFDEVISAGVYELERIREAEEAETKRQAALRPDKEKLLALGNTIVQLPLPEVSSEDAAAILKDVQELLNKVQLHIVKKVKTL